MTAQPLEPRVSRLEGAFEQIVERLGDTNARLETLEVKLDTNFHALDSKIAAMDAKFESKFTAIDAKLDTKFNFLVGVYVTTTLALGGTFFAAISPLYREIAHLTLSR